MKSSKMIRVRFGDLSDEERIKELWNATGLSSSADLPLASKDPATAITLVGVDDNERVLLSIILRLCSEAHLIMGPEAGERDIRRIIPVGEGALMHLSNRLIRQGFPGITDVDAFVPPEMERMIEFMKVVKFTEHDPPWRHFWKKLGDTRGPQR